MSRAAISPNQWTILEALEDGPAWIRSFQPAKRLLDDLIDKGFVERCRPFLGRAKNMVRLTEQGKTLLFADQLAEHGDVGKAATAVGQTMAWGRERFAAIRRALGPQAI
jgi:predicted ArsR family transcriptional regulator